MKGIESKIVIGIAGRQGAGKSTLAHGLASSVQESAIIKVSDVLTETLRLWNIPTYTSNLQKLSDSMKSTF